MSFRAATVARRAFVRQPLRPAAYRQPLRQPLRRYSSKVEEAGLDTGPKRDPELYVLLGIMMSGFALVGWYFGRKPTASTSESNVRVGEGAMPWEMDDEKAAEGKAMFKYQYHPHGDTSKPAKNAPSALNEVVIPNVTLPQDLHERFNKYGKDL